MDTQQFLLAIAFTFTVLFTIQTLKKNKHKNLPPSPPSLPIVGHLHLLYKPLHHCLTGLTDRYGPVVLLRFGSRRVLVVSSPTAANECFTVNDVVFANRPQIPSFRELSYNYTTMGSLRYGPLWRNFRRISAVEVLSTHRLLSFSDVRADEVRSLVRLLLAKHGEENSVFAGVELKSRLFELAMNITMRMIAGKRYYGEGNGVSEEASRFRAMMREMGRLVAFSYPSDCVPALRRLGFNRHEVKMKRLQDARDEFLQELIDEQRRNYAGDEFGAKKTMIRNLLESQKSDPENYSDLIIKALTISLLQAGTSTTSDTIEWAMTLLLNHPNTLKKLRDEIDELVGNERLLDENDITKLPYLQCVINETLRLQPTAPLLLPHQSHEDCTVEGYNIPSETMLMVNVYAIQRDPKVWKEPLQFKPERFENELEFEGKKMTNWMAPFGMGRRKCVGEGLAIRVIGLTIGTLIQCFDWERIDGKEIDMTESSSVSMAKATPLQVLYRPRSQMNLVLSRECE